MSYAIVKDSEAFLLRQRIGCLFLQVDETFSLKCPGTAEVLSSLTLPCLYHEKLHKIIMCAHKHACMHAYMHKFQKSGL